MHFTSSHILPFLSTSILASPLLRARSSWTIQSFTRTCDDATNNCAYSFGISVDDGSAPTTCAYDVVGSSDTKAEYQSYNNVTCGAYFIGSTWSGQFGPGQGFSTLSVVTEGQIVYPAYRDVELANGVAYSPDKSYVPAALPAAKYVAPKSVN